ncbi:MAG: hypothetical protein JXR37_00040 [Kiritimatiellae bacterium]|nr:hypothetical protein [Kiritimatiellia bacterium]
MNSRDSIRRPLTLRDVAAWPDSLHEFGLNLRDWQHSIQREGVHSRPELSRRIAAAPRLLAGRFRQGDVADAYLAAYAEWLADLASVPRPRWCADTRRVAREPWFSSSVRGLLLVNSPASFRQRNLFTKPEPVFTPRVGRPRVSQARKREKARLRQKAYRVRIRALVEQARRSAGRQAADVRTGG